LIFVTEVTWNESYGCHGCYVLQKLRQTHGAMWSLSELTQAIVIVAHVHALAVFLAGCKLYSVDAMLSLFKPCSCSELPTDKSSVPDCSSHLSNTLVSLLNSIICLRSVD